MTILYNAAGYKPAYNLGGPVQTLSALGERLVQRGHRVFVAATDSNLTEKLDIDTECWHDVGGVQVRYFRIRDSWTKRLPFSYFRKSMADYRTRGLASWLEGIREPFDIVHSQLPFLHSNRICSSFANSHGVPYLYSQHGVFDPVRLRYRKWKKELYLRLYELPVCRAADVLVALNAFEESTYRRLGLVGRVEIIPNGVELPDDRDHAWPFPEFSTPSSEPLVLFLSRLHRLKGPDVAVEAFANARKATGVGKLVIAGPDEHGWMSGLRETARARGIAEHVLFLGPVGGEVKSGLLARSDIFLLPTVSEGFSMSLLEAAAARCAILTTPGAHFDELERAGAGMIVTRSPEALGEALVELIRDPALRKKMGENARALVHARYTWEGVVGKLEGLYQELRAGPNERMG